MKLYVQYHMYHIIMYLKYEALSYHSGIILEINDQGCF